MNNFGMSSCQNLKRGKQTKTVFTEGITVRSVIINPLILKFPDHAPLSAPSRLAHCYDSKFEIKQGEAGRG